MDLMTRNTKIPALIAYDRNVSSLLPLTTCVKRLVEMAIEPESRDAQFSAENYVSEPAKKCVSLDQLLIGECHSSPSPLYLDIASIASRNMSSRTVSDSAFAR